MNIGKGKRRTTATSIVRRSDMDDASEEAVVLLENEESDSQGGEPEDIYRYGYPDRSNWIRPLSLAFMTVLLTTIAFSSFTILFLKPSLRSLILDAFHSNENALNRGWMVGIELHPEDHVFRAPRTIIHNWTITSAIRSPDGVKKSVYLVNGEFPGPTIECRSGDKLVIHVTNDLQSGDGVSIHWHGLNLRNANIMDGAVGFTQCPIPVGGMFQYEFGIEEEQAGTFWWHAHSQVHRGDGMYGGLVVHKPAEQRNDMDVYGYEKEILLLVGDWYHRGAEEVLAWFTSAKGFGNEPVPDSLLINGVGSFICSMAIPARPVECEAKDEGSLGLLDTTSERKSIRLRVVNVGSLAGFTLSVDSEALTPLTVDGGYPISAHPTHSVGILYPGERVDILLNGNSFLQARLPRLHVTLDPENLKYNNPALRPNQSFPLFQGLIETPEVKTAPSEHDTPLIRFDLAKAIPSFPHGSPIPITANQTILLYTRTEKLAKFANHPKGFINRTSWSPQLSSPLISLPRAFWDNNQLIPYIPFSTPALWIDLIVNNLDDGSHPFHLHGHSFYVLASSRSEHGWGSYSPFKNPEPNLNLVNPVKKDTISVPRRGYVVVRFKADNEGIWMLHCHVLFHQGSGMAMGLQVGGDEGHEVVDLSTNFLCPK